MNNQDSDIIKKNNKSSSIIERIEINMLSNMEDIKAIATISLNDGLFIENIKIRENERGPWLQFPLKNSVDKLMIFTNETREDIRKAILEEYNNTILNNEKKEVETTSSNFKSKEVMTTKLSILDCIEDIKFYDNLDSRFHTPGAQEAMANLEEIFALAPDEIKHNKKLVLKILEYDINCLKDVPEELRRDPEIQERALLTLKNYKIQERYNLIDFKTDENGEIVPTINMSNIEDIVSRIDFKEEERYVQLYKELSYEPEYNNNNNNDNRRTGKDAPLLYAEWYIEYLKNQEIQNTPKENDNELLPGGRIVEPLPDPKPEILNDPPIPEEEKPKILTMERELEQEEKTFDLDF